MLYHAGLSSIIPGFQALFWSSPLIALARGPTTPGIVFDRAGIAVDPGLSDDLKDSTTTTRGSEDQRIRGSVLVAPWTSTSINPRQATHARASSSYTAEIILRLGFTRSRPPFDRSSRRYQRCLARNTPPFGKLVRVDFSGSTRRRRRRRRIDIKVSNRLGSKRSKRKDTLGSNDDGSFPITRNTRCLIRQPSCSPFHHQSIPSTNPPKAPLTLTPALSSPLF